MKCPNCGKEMKDAIHKYCWGFVDTDDEYYIVEERVCNKCKITFTKDYKGENWDIPYELQATPAQIKACQFVRDELGYNVPPPTKVAMWRFLRDTLDEANKHKEKKYIDNNEEWGLDNFAFPCEEDCF